MKLRNLLFGTMIALAFTACSDKDDPIPVTPDPIDEVGTAQMAVKMQGLMTKAEVDDATISNLYVLVFKNAGTDTSLEKVYSASETEIGSFETEKFGITSGAKSVFLLANYNTDATDEANLAELEAYTNYAAAIAGLTKSFDDPLEADGALTMNSRVYQPTLARDKVNYLGWAANAAAMLADPDHYYLANASGLPIYLYRNVAKVSFVEALTPEDAEVAELDGYADPELAIEEIFILNARYNTNLVGLNGAQWGYTEVEDGEYLFGFNYSDFSDFYRTERTSYLAWVNALDEVFPTAAGDLEDIVYVYEDAVPYAPATDRKDFYVYENLDMTNPTLLCIKGTFSYTDKDGVAQSEPNRYYTVKVGEGVTYGALEDSAPAKYINGGAKVEGVIRNIQYNISIIARGPGSDSPIYPGTDGGGDEGDDPTTHLMVKYEVVPFGQVNQTPDPID